MRNALRLASLILTSAAVCVAVPSRLDAAGGPLNTPAGSVRFYFHALGTGQCDLAYKFSGPPFRSLRAFRRSCRAIRRIAIEQLADPGYRLHPQTAAYTCLAVQYVIYRRQSGAMAFGGWYLMERTLGPAWHILFSLSHIVQGGTAISLTRAQCAGHLPSYVRPGSGTIVSGFDFLSAATGWIALSTSGSYLPNGSCTHGIGTNCEAAPTTVYRTVDAGVHWTPMLRFTTTVGPPVWIRLFDRQVGLVAATVGPLRAAANAHFTATLFSTHDGGRHWQRLPLPVSYATETGTISFPDPHHGWLWYGGGAAGSMSVYLYRTSDGGGHWARVACAAFSNPTPGFGCARSSGIALGGDKEYLTFKDRTNGWLTAYSNSGVPDLYRTADGGASWHRQSIALPPGVALPTAKSTVFPSGTFLQPRFFGRVGLLPESVGFYRPKLRASWNRLYLFRSTDGGRTWPLALRTPVTASTTIWQALDSSHWRFVSPSTIWSTENGGASWTRRPLHLPAGLMPVGFQLTDTRDGWVTAQTKADSEVTASGTALLRTRDGGAHWTETRLP